MNPLPQFRSPEERRIYAAQRIRAAVEALNQAIDQAVCELNLDVQVSQQVLCALGKGQRPHLRATITQAL